MNARTRSAVTKTPGSGRTPARNKTQDRSQDVGELFLAELAARRARLQELLGLIRIEVARELAIEEPPRIGCRRAPSARGTAAIRAARAN
jgi:hypothetical protein